MTNSHPFTPAFAFESTGVRAGFKTSPEDFVVIEQLGFEPDGEGEHLWLNIRKRNLTTEAVIADLARLLSIPRRDIACSGLKDKQAITEQWFSLPWPIKKPLPEVSGSSWQLLRMQRHGKKLRRGVHKENAFEITLRDLEGDISRLEARLNEIIRTGFPNYFGEQRFGRDGQNVEKALALFSGKLTCKPFQRSIYYSAVRSHLFNAYLHERVKQQNWNQALAGDVFNLQGSNACFSQQEIDQDIVQRLHTLDIHPCGPLPGKGASGLTQEAARLQEMINERYPMFCQGLLQAGIETATRPLRAVVKSLNWRTDNNKGLLSFQLRSGTYATALLRELVSIKQAEKHHEDT